ncbi:MAG TPA: hypothetical protein ENI80_04825 [Acidiferrobacteraceae bacterium]|nr:hypothetical protein [Acidiferrobacteraceae bacterium]
MHCIYFVFTCQAGITPKLCGGTGASTQFDGYDAVHSHMTNSRLTDLEVLEWRFPVLLEEFSIRKNSGGQGQHAGGNGTRRRLRFLEPMTAAILSNRRNKELAKN